MGDLGDGGVGPAGVGGMLRRSSTGTMGAALRTLLWVPAGPSTRGVGRVPSLC